MQGDPVSPALFDLMLDWALAALPKVVRVEVGGVKHQYLTFADDVVLLAATPMGLKKAVESLVAAAAGLGLVGVAIGIPPLESGQTAREGCGSRRKSTSERMANPYTHLALGSSTVT